MSYWYSFILGRTPELSIAELQSVLLPYASLKIIESSAHFFIIETHQALDVKKLMNMLGGTIKIGKGLVILPDTRDAACKLSQTLIDTLESQQKIYFGISAYNLLPNNFNSYKLGLEIKTSLKETFNRASRLVSSREPVLSSVVVATNKLLSSRGAELQIFFLHNKLYIARTAAVQDFADFSKRDYNRPSADPKSGMLPPKIARIMINIARVQEGDMVLDPFCGSGTIIMEAALLHPHNKLYGSDLSKHAIQNTQKNLQWLNKEYGCSEEKISLINNAVETLNTKILPQSIDVIITEPYLGPPIRGTASKEKLNLIIKELNPLYEKTLFVFKELLKPSGRVVMIWPVFSYQKNWLELPAFKTIKKYFDFVFLSTHEHGILYARPEQKVGRYIVKLTPKI